MATSSPARGRKREQDEQGPNSDEGNSVYRPLPLAGAGAKRRATLDSGGQLATAAAGTSLPEPGPTLPPASSTCPGTALTAGSTIGSQGLAWGEGGGEGSPLSDPGPPTDAQPPAAATPKPPLPHSFNIRSFYGSRLHRAGSGNNGTPQRNMEERVLRFLCGVQHSIQAAAEDAGVVAPSVWHVFPTQQPAFDLADSQPGLEVFSVEHGQEGKRRFLTTSRGQFWQRYRYMLPQHRHYYEIIRQGAPCHLYFDLEYVPADNPAHNGTAAVDALLTLVRDQLHGSSFQLEMKDSWVLELDSSTETKFSRHVVVRVPGAAFASNVHVGAFVLQLCATAKERQREDPRCALLIVKKGDEEALFVDTAVYTRNRAFRLYLSSKCGKKAVLENTGRFGGAGLSMHECFEAGLVTNASPGARLLRCFDDSAEEAAAAAAARAARGAAVVQLPVLRGVPRGALPSASHVFYGPCPYPELEAFINSVCCEGGVQGRVRSWVLLEEAGQAPLLILNMRDNRFCGNVGRAHKSNGIFYVVDLKDDSWYQKCYDPECRYYRSPLTPLPPHLLGLWCQAAVPATPTCGFRAPAALPQQQQGSLLPQGSNSCAGATFCASCGGSNAQGGFRCRLVPLASREADDDILMLQALERYEQAQQAQQQQQQGTKHPTQQQQQQTPELGGGAAGAAPGTAAAAAVGPPDDGLLLQALLQYEQQAGGASPSLESRQHDGTSAGRTAVPPSHLQQPQRTVLPTPGHPPQAQARQQQQRSLAIWEKFL